MFCQNCGFKLPDGAVFCPQCGAKLNAAPAPVVEEAPAPVVEEAPAPVVEEAPAPAPVVEEAPAPVVEEAPAPQPTPAPQPVYQPAQNGNVDELSQSALVWGILGLAFACSFFASVLGIVFSIIGKNKYAEYAAAASVPSGKGKVGGILARIGLPVGIAMTACFFIYLMCIIILAAL